MELQFHGWRLGGSGRGGGNAGPGRGGSGRGTAHVAHATSSQGAGSSDLTPEQ